MTRQHTQRTLQKLLIGLAATAFAGGAAAAINFEFEASDAGGTGKAVMSFADSLDAMGSSQFLSISIDNISPTTLNDGTGVNAPGISAFGFDLDVEPIENLLGWQLQALSTANGALVTIGNSYGNACFDGSCLWSESGDGGGFGPSGNPNFQLEYIHGTQNAKGLLYSPDAPLDGLAAEPNYFTTAVLTLEFASSTTSVVPTSTALRMMNVGSNGAGSITMAGDLCEAGDDCDGGGGGGGGQVPEPTGLALMALALTGFGITRRRNARR